MQPGATPTWRIPSETRYFRLLKLAWDFKQPDWDAWCPGQLRPLTWLEDLALMIDALLREPDEDRAAQFPPDPALGGP